MDEQHEGIDWDAEFRDMMNGSDEEQKNFCFGTLKLFSGLRGGFEIHFQGEGQAIWAYPLTDIQAADLALTIMTIIGNRR